MGQQDDTRPAFGLRFSDLLSVSLYHVEEAGMMKTEERSRSWDYIGVGSSATSKPNLDVADARERLSFKSRYLVTIPPGRYQPRAANATDP